MKGRIYIYMFMLLCLILSCSGKETKSDNIITVTIEPYRFLVEHIAGPDWHVVSLMPKGANPETLDPSPRQITALSDSRAYMLVGGLGFENVWRDKIAAIHPHLYMVDTSKGIERYAGDPHLWTSPDNMIVIARNVCDALCRMDSVGHDEYCKRLVAFEELIRETDTQISESLRNIRGASFLIFHPSLTYFARLYGLNQLSIEHDGKEPSASHIQTIIEQAKEHGVKTVFVQQEFDKKNSEVIARELGADIVTIDPLSYNWQKEMLHIADCLRCD